MVRALAFGRQEAGKSDIDSYRMMFSRNIGAITQEEQETLRNSSAVVVGCGGIGGAATEMLARSGIGRLTAIDGDSFDISNINRQIFSRSVNIGKKKAKEAERCVRQTIPSIEFTSVAKEITESNATKLIQGHDIVVDGLDNALSRVIVSRTAKDLQLPYVFGACERTRGYATVFTPSGISYERAFNLPSNGMELDKKITGRLESAQRCDAVLGVVPNLIGCAEAMLVISVLLKKDFVQPPDFIHVSAFDKVPFRIGPL